LELKMAYDHLLARRLDSILNGIDGLTSKKMFGGIGYMIHGNMSCGVNGSDLIVRVGPDDYQDALAEVNVKEFDMTGRAMRGWVVVTSEGIQSEEALKQWVMRGVRFAQSLPPK
jgi:TfoX/Sxy family transcriptional regulator of competence genes